MLCVFVCPQVLSTCEFSPCIYLRKRPPDQQGIVDECLSALPPSESVCSFLKLKTVCSEAWERLLHTCLAHSRWWRGLGSHPPVETASAWDAGFSEHRFKHLKGSAETVCSKWKIPRDGPVSLSCAISVMKWTWCSFYKRGMEIQRVILLKFLKPSWYLIFVWVCTNNLWLQSVKDILINNY